MATWIKLYDSLPQHKKLMRFRKLLKISTAEAVGLLCLLWLWAINNAQDGDLSDIDAQDIAEVCAWKKKPDALLSALIETGFVTDDMRLHDWDDYAGTLMGRYGIGIELNNGYFRDGVGYLREADDKQDVPTLFDIFGA